MALELEGRRVTNALYLIPALKEFVLREETATHEAAKRGLRMWTKEHKTVSAARRGRRVRWVWD